MPLIDKGQPMQAPRQARTDSDAVHTHTDIPARPERSLIGNRSETVAQRKLAQMMSNSPRLLQQRALSNAIHNSPRTVAQRHEVNALFGGTVKPQGDGAMPAEALPAQPEEKTNHTGLPSQLKAGIESLSGMSMDHVNVHYNSDKPAQLQAHAYAQGSEIYLGAGQNKHLPHEAWHVVQQAQGRVKPTIQMKGKVGVNDDAGLEREADVMGHKALQPTPAPGNAFGAGTGDTAAGPVQRKLILRAPLKNPVEQIYRSIRRFFKPDQHAQVMKTISYLLNRHDADEDYDNANQAHQELLAYQVKHLLGQNLAPIAAEVAAAAKPPGTNALPFQIAFLGGGASIAYYVSTMGSGIDFSHAAFIYTEQPWRTERGPGVVAHPEHMITPSRKYLDASLGPDRKMDQWMKRDAFSDKIEGVIADAKAHATRYNKKVKQVASEHGLYKITLDDDSVIYAKKVVSGLGAGGHILPSGANPENLHTTPAVAGALSKRIMNMDVFTQVAGYLQKNDGIIYQRPDSVAKKKRGGITLVLSGGNAALDVAYDALAKGYKVKWITGNSGATFLPGFLNQAAAVPYWKKQVPPMPVQEQQSLKREIQKLYKGQHIAEHGVSSTNNLEEVVRGRATSVSQTDEGVEAKVVDQGGATSTVKGDVLAFAIGPNLSTQKIFSKDILHSLVPLRDKNHRFTDDRDATNTHLAVGTANRSLQIVGGGAFRFTPTIARSAFNEPTKVGKLAQLSLALSHLRGDKKRKPVKRKFAALKKELLHADLEKLQFRGPYSLKNASNIVQSNRFWTSSMDQIPASLPRNVLISDQLTAILTQTQALNEDVPRDVNRRVNFLIDDRTTLRIHLSSRLPDLPAIVGDTVVSDIIKFRHAKNIGYARYTEPAAVPPYQDSFQTSWEMTMAASKPRWSVDEFSTKFIVLYHAACKKVRAD